MATASKKSKANKVTAPDRMRSFRVYPNEKPFFTVRLSQQTFYWLIIGVLVLGLGIWSIFLTVKVQTLYDQLNTTILNESM